MRRLTTPAAAPSGSVSRRHLLQGSGAALAAGFAGTLGALHTRLAQAQAQTGGGKQLVSAPSPYGPIAPIAPVPDLETGIALL